MSKRYVKNAIHSINGDTLQALPPNVSNSFSLSFTGVSANQSLSSADIIRITSDQDVWLNFGDSGVTAAADDLYFSAGTEILVVPEGATHVAALQVATGGTLRVTEMGGAVL